MYRRNTHIWKNQVHIGKRTDHRSLTHGSTQTAFTIFIPHCRHMLLFCLAGLLHAVRIGKSAVIGLTRQPAYNPVPAQMASLCRNQPGFHFNSLYGTPSCINFRFCYHMLQTMEGTGYAVSKHGRISKLGIFFRRHGMLHGRILSGCKSHCLMRPVADQHIAFPDTVNRLKGRKRLLLCLPEGMIIRQSQKYKGL